MPINPFTIKISGVLFLKLLFSLKSQKHAPDTTNHILSKYDYIVIGAGSAGSTLAARLSEESCVNVLLLEAGKSPPLLTELPALGRNFLNTNIDWRFYTVPQKYTGNGLYNRQVSIPRGKVIGGTSIINAMIYVRGDRRIFDKWEAGGATGWSYRDVLPYFKKMEMNRNPETVETPYHGFKGPLTVERPVSYDPYRLALQAAVHELGQKPVDVNGRYAKGFYDYQSTTRKGQRCSTAKAYLVPAENRKNLYIVKNAYVTKIMIDNRRAVGVQFDYGGKMYIIRATREVIVSAGSLNTPKLLMLSGIGPKEHLEELDIPVIADLPVGKNLLDHPTVVQSYYTDQVQHIITKATDPKNIATYLTNRTGILAEPVTQHYLMFWTKEQNSPPDAVPDYELYFSDGWNFITRNQMNMKKEIVEAIWGPYEFKAQMWCLVHNLHTKSRGVVKLRSTNPYDHPLIDPNYFADPRDLADIVKGMKQCDRVVNTHALRSLGIKPLETVAPGCEKYVEDINAYYTCVVKLGVLTLGHQVGTAKMGDPYDPTTVVDPELRVKYVKGLRVVDASVMPLITNGNTHAPTVMIAEKAADMIKKDLYCGFKTDDHFLFPANDDNWWDRATQRIRLPSL